MAVTAILPVPIEFAGRREAVFASVAGVSPLARVVRVLGQRCDVVVACAAPLAGAVREALAGQNFSRIPVVVSVPNGERVQCVAAGLRELGEGDEVLVHDIGWPIVGVGTLDRIIASLRDGAAAVMPASPVTDSVKAIAGGLLTATLDRSQLQTVQYPRGFAADVLAELVRRSGSGTFDELEAVLSTGTPLTFIEGDDEALSVDLPGDADYLAALIVGRQNLAGP
ncbi:MAG: 2-C-methyl-D-erythritol 4-phosphate cytidylyltransferase [Actinomycetia bacterium]|nr:2-C-methyl-D-erythritol 4-phosphate cytidylyltransferase [Actinomycetes bacterium]